MLILRVLKHTETVVETKELANSKMLGSLCSELCVVLNELQAYPLKVAKAATLIWLFPALQRNLAEVLIGSAESMNAKGRCRYL